MRRHGRSLRQDPYDHVAPELRKLSNALIFVGSRQREIGLCRRSCGRKLRLPLSRGNFSIIGRTPVSSAKHIVSSESVGIPEAQPWMRLLPKRIFAGGTSLGSIEANPSGTQKMCFARNDGVISIAEPSRSSLPGRKCGLSGFAGVCTDAGEERRAGARAGGS